MLTVLNGVVGAAQRDDARSLDQSRPGGQSRGRLQRRCRWRTRRALPDVVSVYHDVQDVRVLLSTSLRSLTFSSNSLSPKSRRYLRVSSALEDDPQGGRVDAGRVSYTAPNPHTRNFNLSRL
jgi:hypothetical protein